MLNKTDFELKEIKTENNHIDYYFICFDNAQEEFKKYYDDILIQKVIFSIDENIIIMECNDNGYIYNTLCDNDQLVQTLIKILNNFASVKRHKMEIDKEAIEKAIDSIKYFSSACEIACKDEYITWEDDYKAWKENQALLKKYIPTTIKPFPQTIKVPP